MPRVENVSTIEFITKYQSAIYIILVLRLNWFISNARSEKSFFYFIFDDIVLFETNENNNFRPVNIKKKKRHL